MADIEGLKQRIELIDLRLKTAHSARERESAALMEMWEQIRERFQQQNSEILDLRNRISSLEDTRSDLQNMVINLLGSVESGLARMSDETVPQIRKMALDLLDKQEAEHADRSWQPNDRLEDYMPSGTANGDSQDNDFLTELERSMAEPAETEPDAIETDGPLSSGSRGITAAPVSPGIRDLIARIGSSVAQSDPPADESMVEEAETLAPEALTRDLLEIEHLRNELLGLRARISHDA